MGQTVWDLIQGVAQGRVNGGVGAPRAKNPDGSTRLPDTLATASSYTDPFGDTFKYPATQKPVLNGGQVVVTPQEQAQRQIEQEQEQASTARLRGRSSTLLTGGTGLLDSPYTSRRSLLGF